MTKDDIILMAREAGLYTHKDVQPELVAFANLAAATEREECARLCEDLIGTRAMAVHCADAIRARGTT